jgi:hypothetical protein
MQRQIPHFRANYYDRGQSGGIQLRIPRVDQASDSSYLAQQSTSVRPGDEYLVLDEIEFLVHRDFGEIERVFEVVVGIYGVIIFLDMRVLATRVEFFEVG